MVTVAGRFCFNFNGKNGIFEILSHQKHRKCQMGWYGIEFHRGFAWNKVPQLNFLLNKNLTNVYREIGLKYQQLRYWY